MIHGRAQLHQAGVRPGRFSVGAGLTLLVLSVAACDGAVTQVAPEDVAISDCDHLSAEAADLVVATADHAASSGGGLPRAALEADHPEDLDGWDLAAALARSSDELEARVEAARDAAGSLDCAPGPVHAAIDARVREELAQRGEQLSEEFDREQHTAMNLMAIAAATFEPAPAAAAELPQGFPAAFPVHPDATRIGADRAQDGSVSATWQAEEAFAVVADYYRDALQEGRPGGWDVSRSDGAVSQDVGGGTTGDQRFEITGYGFAGELTVTSDEPGHVVIRAELSRQE